MNYPQPPLVLAVLIRAFRRATHSFCVQAALQKGQGSYGVLIKDAERRLTQRSLAARPVPGAPFKCKHDDKNIL